MSTRKLGWGAGEMFPLVGIVAMLSTMGCGPPPSETLFPGEGYGGIDLSVSLNSIRYCGLDVGQPEFEGELYYLTGGVHRLDEPESEESRVGEVEQEDDEQDKAESSEEPLSPDEKSAELCRERAQRAREVLRDSLDGRIDRRRYRQMLALLESHLYDHQRLAILEFHGGRSDRGSYVVLADTPRGWRTATDLAPWSPQLAEYGLERHRARPMARVVPAQADLAEAFFEAVQREPMPDVMLVGKAAGPRAGLWAVLHVFYGKERYNPYRTWRLVLTDQDAWLMMRGMVPVQSTDVGPEVLETMRPEGYGQPDHDWPHWKDVLLDASERQTYERLRAYFIGKAKLFWQAGVGRLDRKGDGWERALRAVRVNGVYGSAISDTGSEGTFWRLSRGFLRVASNEDFYAMLNDENVKVRAMALTCLAEKDRAGRAAALRSRLGGREDFLCIPFGCCGHRITEGEFALSLIHNTRFLDPYTEYAPAMPRVEQLALDLHVLRRDECAGGHHLAGNALSWAVYQEEIELTMPVLRELALKMSDLQIVKAIGRMRPEDTVRDFLLGVLGDEAISGDCRLAAGSALTRDTDQTVLQALASAQKQLDELAEGAGTEFLRLARCRARIEARCRAYEDLDGSYDSEGAEQQKLARELMEACADCPVVGLEMLEPLDLLDWPVGAVLLASPALARWREAVVGLSARLGDYQQPWNTYSDLGYRLEFLLRTAWFPCPSPAPKAWDDGGELTEEELEEEYWGRLGRANWETINRNVRAYLKRRDASAGD